jgi:hypothetical protein
MFRASDDSSAAATFLVTFSSHQTLNCDFVLSQTVANLLLISSLELVNTEDAPFIVVLSGFEVFVSSSNSLI